MAFTRLLHPPYDSKPLPINTISLNIKGSIIQSKILVPISKVFFIKDKEYRRDITDIDLHCEGRSNSISCHPVLLCSFFDAVDGHFPRTMNGTKRYSIYVFQVKMYVFNGKICSYLRFWLSPNDNK